MKANFVASASTTIDAPAARVWHALVTPAEIERYMFGSTVASDWREGSPITWSGEWKGKKYQDKGVVRRIVPERTLEYTHFSPLAGVPDVPENYHTVTIELAGAGQGTRVTLKQDGNASEKERDQAAENWKAMLDGLKKVVEGR